MKQGNKTLIWVVAAVMVLGICGVGGIVGLMFFARAGQTAAAKNIGDEIMVRIAKPWNAQEIASMADRYSANPLTLERAQKIAKAYEKEFGSLLTIKGEINSMNHLRDAYGDFVNAEYVGYAQFEKSEAQVILELTKRDGKWYLDLVAVAGPNSPRGAP